MGLQEDLKDLAGGEALGLRHGAGDEDSAQDAAVVEAPRARQQAAAPAVLRLAEQLDDHLLPEAHVAEAGQGDGAELRLQPGVALGDVLHADVVRGLDLEGPRGGKAARFGASRP